MSNDVFDVQILNEKLSKLNNSQQSIECILYLEIFVDIWEERKVFGSRGQGLKDEMLGKNPPPQSASNGKSSNPIKIVKRDAQSVRIKLAVGGLPEKILTAFQSVIDEHFDEEAALNKCSTAVFHVGKIREEMENGSTLGNQQGSTFVDELQAQENVLQQCVGKLESAEANRTMLISQLTEALEDQESKLDVIRAQLQVARGQIEQAVNLRSRLTSPIAPGSTTTIPMPDSAKVKEHNTPPVQPTSTPLPTLAQPVVSFAPMKTTDEESKKAAAAAVAAKLAASTSSAQMLTSVLSSLVAEEAASMNGGLKSTGFTTGLAMFPSEKRQKLEKPMPVSDSNSEVGNIAYFNPLQQQPGTTVPLVPPSSSMQSMSQSNQIQTSFGTLPPLPPPPPLSPANAPANQFVQSSGMVIGAMPFGYGTNALPPPPPLPPHIAMGLARPAAQPSQQSQSQQPQQQQAPATGGFYRPPGIGFYGQNHQPATPPVPRQ
ncbi:formin-like protein 7 isoform X2 [Hevea brasiliensis]|uniref:formin-like protein 7 isoform X2 n=1 Tax=Hevea brasiliensis TaxID=3981 RepID=UPI000B7927A9|nr:formin-like protein 7 isoform X2 [Hevea brasiliensis]